MRSLNGNLTCYFKHLICTSVPVAIRLPLFELLVKRKPVNFIRILKGAIKCPLLKRKKKKEGKKVSAGDELLSQR